MKFVVLLLAVVAAGPSSLSETDFLVQRRAIPLQVDYVPAPETWQEAAARSEVAAVVRLGRHRSTQLRIGPMTVFEAEVIEVIRNTGQRGVGSIIDIARYGGIVNTSEGEKIQQEAHFPPWSMGTTLLVFLNWYEPVAAFTPAFGPNAAFEIDRQGNARTFGRSRLSTRQNGRSFADLLTEIKAGSSPKKK